MKKEKIAGILAFVFVVCIALCCAGCGGTALEGTESGDISTESVKYAGLDEIFCRDVEWGCSKDEFLENEAVLRWKYDMDVYSESLDDENYYSGWYAFDYAGGGLGRTLAFDSDESEAWQASCSIEAGFDDLMLMDGLYYYCVNLGFSDTAIAQEVGSYLFDSLSTYPIFEDDLMAFGGVWEYPSPDEYYSTDASSRGKARFTFQNDESIIMLAFDHNALMLFFTNRDLYEYENEPENQAMYDEALERLPQITNIITTPTRFVSGTNFQGGYAWVELDQESIYGWSTTFANIDTQGNVLFTMDNFDFRKKLGINGTNAITYHRAPFNNGTALLYYDTNTNRGLSVSISLIVDAQGNVLAESGRDYRSILEKNRGSYLLDLGVEESFEGNRRYVGVVDASGWAVEKQEVMTDESGNILYCAVYYCGACDSVMDWDYAEQVNARVLDGVCPHCGVETNSFEHFVNMNLPYAGTDENGNSLYFDWIGRETIDEQEADARTMLQVIESENEQAQAGLMFVSDESMLGFVDAAGNLTIDLSEYPGAECVSRWYTDGASGGASGFIGGLGAVGLPNPDGDMYYTLIDESGEWLIEPTMDFDYNGYSEGVTLVYFDGQYAFFDETGEIVLQSETQFDLPSEGIVRFYEEGAELPVYYTDIYGNPVF